MKMYDIIYKKREGETLSKEELEFFVSGYSDGNIPDYQASAFLMACFLHELNANETKDLTIAMTNSGDVVDLSSIKGIKVDKHSTGGVSDSTTLIVAPLIAACGLKLAKMSGRGLGHTGGTLDKLEAIPNFSTSLKMDEFISQVNDIGLSVMGQTMKLVPADKKMYALRDVTATVDSIPLIASSIMSKKLASGADIIVLDVKVGNGAFLKTIEDARKLARTMVDIGNMAGRKTVALVTDMNQPLGCTVGNAMEVMEAIEILKGERECDLKTVAFELAANLLVLGQKAKDRDQAFEVLQSAIDNGHGIEKLKELITAQHGDAGVVDDFDLFAKADFVDEYKATSDGYLSKINAETIGKASCTLGAGREKKEDNIDVSVGIVVHKRIGDKVSKGDTLFSIHSNDMVKTKAILPVLESAIEISGEKPEKAKLIYDIVS
jgi:pyrimidine-nucleoside phosphorylase